MPDCQFCLSHFGFWSANFFLILPFPDHCFFDTFLLSIVYCLRLFCTYFIRVKLLGGHFFENVDRSAFRIFHLQQYILLFLLFSAWVLEWDFGLIAQMPDHFSLLSGKHVRKMYTPFNPIFILQNWGLRGYTYFS